MTTSLRDRFLDGMFSIICDPFALLGGGLALCLTVMLLMIGISYAIARPSVELARGPEALLMTAREVCKTAVPRAAILSKNAPIVPAFTFAMTETRFDIACGSKPIEVVPVTANDAGSTMDSLCLARGMYLGSDEKSSYCLPRGDYIASTQVNATFRESLFSSKLTLERPIAAVWNVNEGTVL